MGRQFGFFGADARLQRWRDQLEVRGEAVDVASFRLELDATLAYADGTNGGRPPFDPVMMFEFLVIQVWCARFEARTEFLINGLHDPSATVVAT